VDIASLIASFSQGTYAVIRTAAATPTRGVYVAGATSTFNITAAVVPASGNELMSLPEGQRTRETRIVFTTTPLQLGGAGKTYESDHVQIDGESWSCERVERWINPGAGHSSVDGYKCFVQAVRY
jgi:hypothetical protein